MYKTAHVLCCVGAILSGGVWLVVCAGFTDILFGKEALTKKSLVTRTQLAVQPGSDVGPL